MDPTLNSFQKYALKRLPGAVPVANWVTWNGSAVHTFAQVDLYKPRRSAGKPLFTNQRALDAYNGAIACAGSKESALEAAKAAMHKALPRKVPRGTRWSEKRLSHQLLWVENLDHIGARFVGWIDELGLGRDYRHKGWYLHDDGDPAEVYRGCVLALPGKGGEPRYLSAYGDPFNDGAHCIEVAPPQTCKHAAAYGADHIASIMAENERAYQRRWSAARQVEELRAQRDENRAKYAELNAERHKIDDDDTPATLSTVQHRLCKIWREHCAALKTIAELYQEHDLATDWPE